MKQFQKFGVAAAVASVATGAVATQQSTSEVGDLAIVPYYSVLDGTNTGIHVINTSGSTQVIKVRLRRATDSKDALDFNVVMSPYDEWTANIVAGGANGVQVRTADTSCTVPAFSGDGSVKTADMPQTYSEGATEGYVEIIAMAQTVTEAEPIAVSAKHKDGVPADCVDVRRNFFRVDVGDVGDATVKGTHTSFLTSNGVFQTAVSAGGPADNLSYFEDSDNPLKVSFMLTDPTGGLEAGDNAVHIEDFSDDYAMMTNQQPLGFTNTGLLKYDPLNFELPNLAFGAYTSSNAGRQDAGARAGTAMTDGSMFTDLQAALATEAVLNDWAAMETDDGSVHADWVVTLPGQYTMVNPICDMYGDYDGSSSTAVAACSSTAAGAYTGDQNQLPLLLATLTNAPTGELTAYDSKIIAWDREEEQQILPTQTPPEDEDELGFSPNGQADEDNPDNTNVYLPYEVNVLAFGTSDGGTAVESNVKTTVLGLGADKGWARLAIESTNPAGQIWSLSGAAPDDDPVAAAIGFTNPGGSRIDSSTDVAVVGMAVWQRSFSSQMGNNYGRMVEHSKTSIGS